MKRGPSCSFGREWRTIWTTNERPNELVAFTRLSLCLRAPIRYNAAVKKPAADRNPSQANPHAKHFVLANRRARHEYSIDETFDAGIALVGTEVKSIRAGKANLQDAFCKIENGEVWLYNFYIAPYEQGSHWNVEPLRKRKLLLHRREIDILRSAMEQKGFALIPLAIYFQHGYAKVELGLGRGKKLYDKREDIAKRDAEREERRELAARTRER